MLQRGVENKNIFKAPKTYLSFKKMLFIEINESQ